MMMSIIHKWNCSSVIYNRHLWISSYCYIMYSLFSSNLFMTLTLPKDIRIVTQFLFIVEESIFYEKIIISLKKFDANQHRIIPSLAVHSYSNKSKMHITMIPYELIINITLHQIDILKSTSDFSTRHTM